MLIIQSLDDDTETRRLSPVALHGDDYIDLNNGKIIKLRVPSRFLSHCYRLLFGSGGFVSLAMKCFVMLTKINKFGSVLNSGYSFIH